MAAGFEALHPRAKGRFAPKDLADTGPKLTAQVPAGSAGEGARPAHEPNDRTSVEADLLELAGPAGAGVPGTFEREQAIGYREAAVALTDPDTEPDGLLEAAHTALQLADTLTATGDGASLGRRGVALELTGDASADAQQASGQAYAYLSAFQRMVHPEEVDSGRLHARIQAHAAQIQAELAKPRRRGWRSR